MSLLPLLLDACQGTYDNPSIKAGPDGRDGASVTTLPDGTTLLTFSGTPTDGDLRSVLAWGNDLDIELVEADGFAGRVHKGFLSSLNHLWDGVIAVLEGSPRQPEALAPWWKRVWNCIRDPHWPDIDPAGAPAPPLPWEKKLVIVGHSLGGALAQMAGVRLARLMPRVICFAAPMWTDAEGARNYPADVKANLYQAADDLVPFVPPMAYEQVYDADVVSQMFLGAPPLLRQRLAEKHAHKLMADLLHEKTRAATWAKVTAAHGLVNYRAWLSQMSPDEGPKVRAA